MLELLSEDTAARVRAALTEVGAEESQIWRIEAQAHAFSIVPGGSVQAEIRPAGRWHETTERAWADLGRALIAAGGVLQEGATTRSARLVRPGCVLSVCWSRKGATDDE